MGCEYGIPAVEYGTPHATFKVQGIVRSETGDSIPNIRVIMDYDTSYSDVFGKYMVKVFDFPASQDYYVRFSDIDGIYNGSYQATDSLASFRNPEFVNGDASWYEGETSLEINIELKENNQ